MIRSDSRKARSAAKKVRKSSTSSSPPSFLRWATDFGRLTRCVICGSRRIHRKIITVNYSDGTSVPGISAEVCSSCGETYFDPAAMMKLETFEKNRKRKRRTRRAS
jgi:YgiT-type zinc finger domain-containing protein